MKTVNLGRQNFLHQKELISLLEKISQNSLKGCLQVLSLSQTWSLYFEEGELIYAYQSNGMWDIFFDKLQQLFPQLNNLDNDLDGQLQELFNSKIDTETVDGQDYLAICWLVEQQYLNPLQAGKLIEEIVIKMLDAFLKLGDGVYEFIPQSLPDYLPKFCHLDISLLARRCQLRSMNLTNVNLFTQSVNSSKITIFPKLEQEMVLKQKQLMPTQINDIIITQDIEDSALKTHKYNDNQIDQKLYKVLCIDDSPLILKTIKIFLDEQIFTVISVDDSLKALMQILRIKPDIILLDISMPNLNGYELCSLLRKHSNFRDTPVVMVSGKTGFIDKARAKMVKASGYLNKPFSKADLLKVMFSQIGYIS